MKIYCLKRLPKTKLISLWLIATLNVPYATIVSFPKQLIPSEVKAATYTATDLEDWREGDFDGTTENETNGSITVSASGTWEPRSWEEPPRTLSTGAAYVSDGTYIYLLRGVGDDSFWRYSPHEDTWDELAQADFGTYYGAEMVIIGRYIYTLFGGYQKKFMRYDIDLNTWDSLENFPELVWNGGSMATDGTDIYALRGSSSELFFYDVSENEWSEKPDFSQSISYGDLIYKSGYLYNVDTANPNRIWKYDAIEGTSVQIGTLPERTTQESEYALIGNYIYMFVHGTKSFLRIDITDGTVTSLVNTPQNVASGGGLVYHSGDGYIYAFRSGSREMWKYDIANNVFLGSVESPVTLYRGSDSVRYDGKFYIARGYNTPTFYEYDIEGDSWTQKADAPGNIYYYNRGVVAGSQFYYMQGNTTSFYSYNPGTNTWSTLAELLASSSEGVLGYAGAGDYENYIYATGGSGGKFWRYTISGEGADSWSDEAVADLPSGINTRHGASMTTDGANFYLILGGGTPGFYKYTLATNTWAALPDLPFAAAINTDSVQANGKIYAIEGSYEDGLFEYDIDDGSWRKLLVMPEAGGYDMGTHYGSTIEFDGTSTLYITRGGAYSHMLRYHISENDYEESGTWTSPVYDLDYVSSWTSLTTDTTTPGDSSISFQSRTSSDKKTWTDWAGVTSGTISSSANRYIQIKATLSATTDRTQTPSLNSMTITYAGDETVPTNPGAVASALSQQVGGVSLVSGNTYNHPNPYFTFSGSDGQTSVSGYYVYWGTTSDANPKTDGSFQSSGLYTVTESMLQDTYYLRVITKDTAGNESSAVTLFEYTYNGVPGSTSVTFDETSEFTGTATNTSVEENKITLASTDGFWQEERLSLAPDGLQYGAKTWAYVSSTSKIYVFRGANVNTFYGYDIATDTWSTLDNAPGAVYMDGGVVEGPTGYLYGFAGGNSNKVWRYDIVQDEWSDADATDALNNIYYGGAFVYDGSRYIYAIRGDSDDAFWRFDTLAGSGGTWSTLTTMDFGAPNNNANNYAYTGADLVFDGTDTIYAIQGNYRNGFSAYSITDQTWTTLTALPILAESGSAIEYDATNNAIYLLGGRDTADMYKYDIESSTWSILSDAPYLMRYGTNMRKIGDRIYVNRGGNGREMYVYNPVNDTWMVPNRNIFGRMYDGVTVNETSTGGILVKGDGNKLYLGLGNYRNLFVRYDTSTGVVDELPDLPSGAYYGSNLAYDSVRSRIYYHPGVYWNHFYYYDIATNTWTEETADAPPCTPSAGSAFVFDGTSSFYFSCAGGSASFRKFNVLGDSGSKWSTLANITAGVSWGSDMLLNGGYIYATRGSNTTGFYRYDPDAGDTGTWDDASVADLNSNVYIDGWMVDGGDGYLYVQHGNDTRTFDRYHIATNTWSSAASVPANVTYGGSAASGGNNKIYMIPGAGSNNTFRNGVYTYVQQTSTTAFEVSGTYTSQAHDLTSVYKWGNLKVDYTTVSDTTLNVSTRSSSDGSTWSAWADVTQEKVVDTNYEYKVNSSPAQYLQVKFSLTSTHGVYSGVIDSYTINFYQDDAEPTNPTSLTAYTTSAKETELGESNNWYNYSTPTFDWPEAEGAGGSTDTSAGSGITGYYVYFGTASSADPVELGTYTTSTEYTASSLTTGQTYYLRITAADEAGNAQSTIWQPYIYKYDSVNPTIPTGLSADPSGYSATDSFDFEWTASTDASSEVSHYCMKTGATEGTWATDQCQSIDDVNITSVPSYRNGANTFYVRAKDNAGNYSEYATVSYYYNTGSPSAPQTLSVTPTTNTSNSFAFSWSAPAVYLGNAGSLKYYYSINALPTVNSVTETTATSLGASAFATLPGENMLYVVAKDEAGNIDYGNYASISFTANTTAPGIPNNADIADVSVKSTSSWKLAISWESPSSVGAGVASYKIYRSIDASSYTYIASTAGISHVDTGLTQQTYYYKVQACDSANNCGAFSSVVSMYPDGKFIEAAPIVSNPEVSNITTRTSKVSWTTSRTSDSKIQYGKNSGSYFDEEVSNSDHITSHTLTLTNLEPGTTYYYKARWTDEDGNTGVSDEYTFVTEPAPTVKEVKVANIGITSALVEFKVTGASKARLYYGESTSFGGTTELTTSTSESSYTVSLDGLKDGTKYYYKINTFDVDEYEYEGTTLDFETLPRPKISDIKVQQVLGTAQPTVLITWKTNTEVSSIVTFMPFDNPQAARDEVNIALTKGQHQMLLRGLSANSVYSLIVKGRDKIGNEAISDPISLTTSSDSRPPQITDLKIEGTSKTASSESESSTQLVVSWNTDEPSTSQVEFGEGTGTSYSQKTQEDSNLTTNHLVVISGLTSSRVYHLRAISKDGAGNEGKSIDTVTITPKATKSALDLVINNLSEAFGFLK